MARKSKTFSPEFGICRSSARRSLAELGRNRNWPGRHRVDQVHTAGWESSVARTRRLHAAEPWLARHGR